MSDAHCPGPPLPIRKKRPPQLLVLNPFSRDEEFQGEKLRGYVFQQSRHLDAPWLRTRIIVAPDGEGHHGILEHQILSDNEFERFDREGHLYKLREHGYAMGEYQALSAQKGDLCQFLRGFSLNKIIVLWHSLRVREPGYLVSSAGCRNNPMLQVFVPERQFPLFFIRSRALVEQRFAANDEE